MSSDCTSSPTSAFDEVFIKLDDTSTSTKTVRLVLDNFISKIRGNDDKRETFRISSPTFEISGFKFCLNVRINDEPGYTGVGLCNLNDKDLTVSYKLKYLGNKEKKIKRKMIKRLRVVLGKRSLISHEDFEAWSKENNNDSLDLIATLTLHLEGEEEEKGWIVNRKRKIDQEDSPSSVLREMSRKRIYTDFTIVSNDGMKFPCHRAVMATKSSVMRAIMEADMREKKESALHLPYSRDIVKCFVDSFYDEEIDKDCIAREIGSFLDLSESYDLPSLKSSTENLAIGVLNRENMLELFFLGDKYKAQDLRNAAERFIRANKKELQSQDLEETLRNADKNQSLEIIRMLCKD